MAAGPVILVLLSAFDVDQVIELEKYLNGRTSGNFLKSTDNVKALLPPGTRGKIIKKKAFNSGNFGYEIEVQNGPEKGHPLWVYYRTDSPGMKLYSDVAQKEETRKPAEAKALKTTRPQPALREPPEDSSDTIKKSLEKISEGNQKLREVSKGCSDCEISKVSHAGVESKVVTLPAQVEQDSPILDPIARTENPLKIPSTRCRSVGSIDVCMGEGDTAISQLVLRNTESAKIVGRKAEGRAREWRFNREGQAQQDLGVFISDTPNGDDKQGQESFMMFFPRKTLPTSKRVGNYVVMTLPNGETVTYDQNNQVVKGVLSEDSAIGPATRSLSPAKVSYKGQGVVLRADNVGHDPRHGAAKVTISKGDQSCQVAKKELWPDQSESSSYKFKYAADADFDKFLKARCGFGI